MISAQAKSSSSKEKYTSSTYQRNYILYSAVFLILRYPREIEDFLQTAARMGLMNGDWAFITTDFQLAHGYDTMMVNGKIKLLTPSTRPNVFFEDIMEGSF